MCARLTRSGFRDRNRTSANLSTRTMPPAMADG